MSQELKQHRVDRFNGYAKNHISDTLGFDLKDREESLDFTRSLLTAAADQYETRRNEEGSIEFAHANDRQLMSIVARLLEGGPDEILQEELTQQFEDGHVPKGQKRLREFTLSMAETAIRSLHEIHEVNSLTSPDTKVSNKPKPPLPKKSATSAGVYHAPLPPNYADPEDVVKYLFSGGIVSSSHAKALLVTLGYQRPEGELSEGLKNDMQRIRSDLRARIATYKEQGLYEFDQAGVRILSSFITQSASNPNLKLILDDVDAMLAVGNTLANLHKLSNVRGTAPLPEKDKYGDMRTNIPLDEQKEKIEGATSKKPKKTTEVSNQKTYVSLTYTPQPYIESLLDPEDEEHIRVTEMYTPIFGLAEGELKAKFRAYIDPSPRQSTIDAYQEGIIDRIVDTINRELGGYDTIAGRFSGKEDLLIRSLFGIPDKSGNPTPKKSVSELANGSESTQQVIYASLRIIAILVELHRLNDDRLGTV